jgi:hypothetical protein
LNGLEEDDLKGLKKNVFDLEVGRIKRLCEKE